MHPANLDAYTTLVMTQQDVESSQTCDEIIA
jgi:hypothetical protein